MYAEIITIGDEILIGQIIDSNSAYISRELNRIGVSVFQITSVQDDREHIIKALKEAEENADIIILTGGLGPTKDDITKLTFCEYFNDRMVQNQKVLEHIELLFKKYITTPISDMNRHQAMVPSKARVMMNQYGTAPGMWMEQNDKVFVSLPGVPYEMKALLHNEVIPALRAKFHFPYIQHKTLLTYGLGESAIAARLETFEEELPEMIKLAYLPNLGRVRLRLSAKSFDKELMNHQMQQEIDKLKALVHDIFVGFESDGPIEALIGKQLISRQQTLSTAESCTGGRIAELITSISGASQYFRGGIVTYATDTKTEFLGVSEELIRDYSVVSKEVAEAMALGAQRKFRTDYAVSTTGNAGPLKGDSDAEVGTVVIAIATPEKVVSERFKFSNHREKTINKATNKAFEMLLKEILKK
jgi:nicotinamide-nucleotide amidase